MKTIRLFGVLIALVAFGLMVGSAQAADHWYVIQLQNGQTAVTNQGVPPGWYAKYGPYPTEDQAIRASGVGAGLGPYTEVRVSPSKTMDLKPAGFGVTAMRGFPER